MADGFQRFVQVYNRIAAHEELLLAALARRTRELYGSEKSLRGTRRTAWFVSLEADFSPVQPFASVAATVKLKVPTITNSVVSSRMCRSASLP
jgi:hypothetical protein